LIIAGVLACGAAFTSLAESRPLVSANAHVPFARKAVKVFGHVSYAPDGEDRRCSGCH
jgi:hypothetical protein